MEFYLLSAPVSFQFMNVHIENNGKGVARNIKFDFSGVGENPLTENAQLVVDKLNAIHMLRNGLLALGSGKQRISFIFSFIELADKLGEDAFDIIINVSMSYEDSETRLYRSETVIDFSEYKGIVEIGGGNPIYNLYEETKKIREILGGSQSGSRPKRLNINIYSSQDRKEEQEAFKKMVEDQRNKEGG